VAHDELKAMPPAPGHRRRRLDIHHDLVAGIQVHPDITPSPAAIVVPFRPRMRPVSESVRTRRSKCTFVSAALFMSVVMSVMIRRTVMGAHTS
jgi:hypothetical protein